MLRAKLKALSEELAARRRGPGSKKVYRLLAGSHGMRERGGPLRIVREGATLELDDWGAFGDRVELVEQEMAAAPSSTA
jgi:hypothetical protein